MKTILTSIAVIIISAAAYSQNSKVDEVFSKFQDKEGITSVLLTSDLIRFASEIDSKDSGMEFLKKITQVRILSFENAIAQDVVLFEKMVNELSLTGYKELMVVKEKDNNVKMLALESMGRWSDFLLIVTGVKDHAIINVQGSISPKELHGLTKSVHSPGMAYVNKLK